VKVIITGGAGFLGSRLAEDILKKGSLTNSSGQLEIVEEIILSDLALPPSSIVANNKITFSNGDISDRQYIRKLLSHKNISIFHLASIVSSGAEQNFDMAIKININGTLNLFEEARALNNIPKVIFTSSFASYGGTMMQDIVNDSTKITPQSTYGMTKAACELFLSDYTRKGFIDGRGARLPTTIIRPGKPNKAASSFASGVLREPLNGEVCELPVPRSTSIAIGGYNDAIEGLIKLHEIESIKLGDDRTINFPNISVNIEEMIDTLISVTSENLLDKIIDMPDNNIVNICKTWPSTGKYDRALNLGLRKASSLESIIKHYMSDYL
tara:strand:+ start:1440 stop:2417 length:978 start_codon:yes stop_codon:yes gene_type:complete